MCTSCPINIEMITESNLTLDITIFKSPATLHPTNVIPRIAHHLHPTKQVNETNEVTGCLGKSKAKMSELSCNTSVSGVVRLCFRMVGGYRRPLNGDQTRGEQERKGSMHAVAEHEVHSSCPVPSRPVPPLPIPRLKVVLASPPSVHPATSSGWR